MDSGRLSLFLLLVYGLISPLMPPKQCLKVPLEFETKPIKIYAVTIEICSGTRIKWTDILPIYYSSSE